LQFSLLQSSQLADTNKPDKTLLKYYDVLESNISVSTALSMILYV